MTLKHLTLVCGLLLPLAGYAQETALPEAVEENIKASQDTTISFAQRVKSELSAKGDILGMIDLPITSLKFVQARDGVYLVSGNGRFVIQGKIEDVWHRKTLKTLDDAVSTHRVPLTNLNFVPEEQLAMFQIGNQEIPRQGLVFVDPTATHTFGFLKHVMASPEKYNFTVALLPVIGGEEAAVRSKNLYCAKDQKAALHDLVNYTDDSFKELKADCSPDKLILTLTLSEVFDIQKLPHFIREDGLVSEGVPHDIDAWLAQP